MTAEEFRRVEGWLYSITRRKIALGTLKLDLERLDTKAASPPRWMSNPSAVPVSGGSLDSRQAQWMEFIDEYPIRRGELEEQINDLRQQLNCFEKVMRVLREENSQYVQLVNMKYLQKVQPDRVVWELIVVSERTFYRMRRYTVGCFFECIPGRFQNGRKLAG